MYDGGVVPNFNQSEATKSNFSLRIGWPISISVSVLLNLHSPHFVLDSSATCPATHGVQDREPGVSAIRWFPSHGLHSVCSDPLYVPGAQGSEGREFHQWIAKVFWLL